MKIDNGSDASRPLIYLFDVDIETSKKEKDVVVAEDKKILHAPPPASLPPPSTSAPSSSHVSKPPKNKKIFVTPHVGNERSMPENRRETLMCDLVLLVDKPYNFTWKTLEHLGITAEDVLFNQRWQCDLVPGITAKLGLTWRELRGAGLDAQMVVEHKMALDFWVFTFRIDIMFFQTMLFTPNDLKKLRWTESQIRALMGYEAIINQFNKIELREPVIPEYSYD